jgi:hypothetical protein
VTTPTADTTTAKELVINSTISTPQQAKYMRGYIKNVFLSTPMACYEYRQPRLNVAHSMTTLKRVYLSTAC